MIYPNMCSALKNEEDPHRGHQQATSCCHGEMKQVSFPLLEQSKRNQARSVLTYIRLHQMQSTGKSEGFSNTVSITPEQAVLTSLEQSLQFDANESTMSFIHNGISFEPRGPKCWWESW